MDGDASEEDDYEYEYDAVQKETFLVDLDLSSISGAVKSRPPGHRKQLRNPSQKTPQSTSQQLEPVPRSDNGPDVPADGDKLRQGMSDANAHDVSEQPRAKASALQILDFDSRNPIVSFEDQLFSCSWSDMIGTSLFFSKKDDIDSFEDSSTNQKYEMLGTSRIKLVGSRARVSQKPGIRKRGRPPHNEDTSMTYQEFDLEETTGKSLGDLHYSNAKVNMDVKKQARFLENLMDVKRARGDTDNVRTIVTLNMTAAKKPPRVESDSRTVERTTMDEEIEMLNRRVIRGDTEAMTRLQRIYSTLETDDASEAPELPPDVLPEAERSSIPMQPDTPG